MVFAAFMNFKYFCFLNIFTEQIDINISFRQNLSLDGYAFTFLSEKVVKLI